MMSLEQAKAARRAARTQLIGTLAEIQSRVEPSRVMSDAVLEVRERSLAVVQKATEQARQRPYTIAGATLAGALLIAHRPLWRLGRRLFGQAKETSGADNGSALTAPQDSPDAKG